jgi:hypothetical protein
VDFLTVIRNLIETPKPEYSSQAVEPEKTLCSLDDLRKEAFTRTDSHLNLVTST